MEKKIYLEDINIKNNLKKYVCSFCGFRTHKKYNLDRHKTNKHRNEKLETSYMQGNSHQNPLVTQIQYPQNKVNELQGGNSSQNTFLKNQVTQTEQTFPFSQRSRLDNDDKSKENRQDVVNELKESITNMCISLEKIVKLRKQYLKTLEKIDDEIKRKEKRDVFNKYMKKMYLDIFES